MHGPWQRLMWYSRQGRWSARVPSLMSIVQVRNGNSRRTRFIASSTLEADAYGPKYRLPSFGQLPRPLDAREVVVQRDLDVRVALVVLEADVERGLEALDEVALEQERLADRVGHRVLEVHDPVDDRADQVLLDPGRLLLPVAADAAAQARRLADVQHVPARVLHQVHAGPIGKLLEDRLELRGHRRES